MPPREAVAFVARCRDTFALPVVGLMCIPPADEPPGPHFALLQKLAGEAGGAAAVDGDVVGFRDGGRVRRDARARRQRAVRLAALSR